MRQDNIVTKHYSDADGAPCGGHVNGVGLELNFQTGPLGTGEGREVPNGCFVEDVIEACKGRLEFYQQSAFACEENARAIHYLSKALSVLDARTARRVTEGTEGTHELDHGEPFNAPAAAEYAAGTMSGDFGTIPPGTFIVTENVGSFSDEELTDILGDGLAIIDDDDGESAVPA